MARKSAPRKGTATPRAADEQHRRRGPRPKYDPDLLLRELWREFEADPAMSARDAARIVAARHGGPAGIDNRARHLMRLVEREVHQPGPTVLETLFLWARVTREGQDIRRRSRARYRLRAAKMKAASRAWGGLYWRAAQVFSIPLTGFPRVDDDNENLEEYLARLDWWMKLNRDLIC